MPLPPHQSTEWGCVWGGPSYESVECRDLSLWGHPSIKRILAFLKATERSFLRLYADALSSSVFYVTFGGKAEVWDKLLPRPNVEPPLNRTHKADRIGNL